MVDQLELHRIKRTLQEHLRPGIVVVVGSGVSCAEGLPSMSALADHLGQADVHQAGVDIDRREWSDLLNAIRADGLEAALKDTQLASTVKDFVRKEIATKVSVAESLTITDVLTKNRELPFSSLLQHLPQDDRFVVITTNYDRLIELAAATAGFLVDTRSLGTHLAPFHRTDGSYAYARDVEKIGNRLRKVEQRVISLYKPHGSLDWIDFGGQPYRCAFDLGPERALIVTPGLDKYRAGYDQPFDLHRELANQAIDRAMCLLVIGYGFNDDHLETHLTAKMKSGTKTVIVARTLSRRAKDFLREVPSVVGIEKIQRNTTGSQVYNKQQSYELPDEELWHLKGFVQGVFER